jgi:hypothetical protein
MGSGYWLNFSDRTFGEFCEEAVDVDIHSDQYRHARSPSARPRPLAVPVRDPRGDNGTQ